MKIIIAGAGRIGYSVAEILADEGHDITVIDSDSSAISNISNTLDVISVEGNAAIAQTLIDAGAESADLLLAATDRDEINMICGIVARRLGTKNVIARIREPEYMSQRDFLREALGLSKIVNPDFQCAKEISRILQFPTAARVDAFSKGSVEIVEYRIPDGSRLDGVVLKDLGKEFGAKILVSVVERKNEAIIPNGNFMLRAGDRLSITGAPKELRKFFTEAGAYRKPVRNVLIMGGGRMTVYLTRLLGEAGITATVIERDREQCDRLCDLLPDTRIICGDATHSDVLLEAGIKTADAFVALTGEDGDNIITSIYAKNCNTGKIVTKVNGGHFADILLSSGLDCFLSPKEFVAQQLARYVRALNNSLGSSVETLYRLAEGKVEALEFKVGGSAKYIDIPLKSLKLRSNLIIAAIIRDGRIIMPDGETSLKSGDHAIIVTAAGRLKDIDSIVEDGR